MLRVAGAKEIHLRIASPPLVSPCFLGIDIERYKELIAHRRTVDQIKRKIDVDSLGYVSLEGLKKAIGKVPCQFCDGCFTKKYPIKPPA